MSLWKTDYDFKTRLSALVSLTATIVFALYNGFLGVRHASLWHGTISVYYLLLVLIRGMILVSEGRIASRRQRRRCRRTVCLAASATLLVLNAALIVPIVLLVLKQRPVRLTLTAITSGAIWLVILLISAAAFIRSVKRIRFRSGQTSSEETSHAEAV